MVGGAVTAAEKISGTGRVTRVTAKCGFLKSARHGGIFVPPAAALPKDCTSPDLRLFLKEGDVVHFAALPQKPAKNGCYYVATRVSVSRAANQSAAASNADEAESVAFGEPPPSFNLSFSSSTIPAALNPSAGEFVPGMGVQSGLGLPLMEAETAIVSRMDVTFGELWSEAFEAAIFFPGSAYSPLPGEPNRLNTVFSLGDMVLVWARPQPTLHGCTYLATEVQKLEERDYSNSPLTFQSTKSCGSSSEEGAGGGGGGVKVSDWTKAHVVSVGDLFGYVSALDLGSVYVPVSAWRGVDGEEAQSLSAVLSVGDEIELIPVPQAPRANCSWRAVRVRRPLSETQRREAAVQTSAPFHQPLLRQNKASTAQAAVQTALTPHHLLAKAVLNNAEATQLCQKLFPHIMAFVDHSPL